MRSGRGEGLVPAHIARRPESSGLPHAGGVRAAEARTYWIDLQRPPGGRGAVDHYYHFVFDLMWPLFRWIRDAKIDSTATLYLQRNGFFMDMLDGLFEPSIRIVRTPCPRLWSRRQTIVGMNPSFCSFEPADAREFREYLFARLDVAPGPRDGVALIERIESDPYFRRFYRSRRGAGADRRSLLNHQELADRLAERFGKHFRNVALEKLPFREQLQLFRNARLVIGQHGAGLANALWMEPGTQVVELTHEPKPHFVNLCRDNRQRHYSFGIEGKKARVHVEGFLRFLSNEVLED